METSQIRSTILRMLRNLDLEIELDRLEASKIQERLNHITTLVQGLGEAEQREIEGV